MVLLARVLEAEIEVASIKIYLEGKMGISDKIS